MLPIKLKTILKEIQKKKEKYFFKKRLEKISFNLPKKGIRINYGSHLHTEFGKIIHGGKVKIRHLQKIFTENVNNYNLIYLVSSACPPMAEEWVRWAKSRGVKIIWNQDGVAYPAWAKYHWKKVNEQFNRMLNLADYVIYQSEFCRKSADLFLGSVKVPWEIIHNCVDLNIFSPQPQIPSLYPWLLLAAGTHQQPERVWIILECLKILKERGKNVRLILAGKMDWPSGEQQLRKYIQVLGLGDLINRITFFSQVQAPEIYRKAHLCIHPKYKDPCPTVVIEAMACGLPIIGSNSGGLPELVGEQGGILLDVPDSWEKMYYPNPNDMADAVERLFTDLFEWRKRARLQAEAHFGLSKWIARHQAIFKKVLSGVY